MRGRAAVGRKRGHGRAGDRVSKRGRRELGHRYAGWGGARVGVGQGRAGPSTRAWAGAGAGVEGGMGLGAGQR